MACPVVAEGERDCRSRPHANFFTELHRVVVVGARLAAVEPARASSPDHPSRSPTMNPRHLVAITLASAFIGALATPAMAQADTPRVDQAQARQQARIAQGAASGALTGRELRRLECQQHAINHAERRAKADGVVTRNERRRLAHAQQHASHDIHRQKHDAQTAPGN
jgi:hypothetical protein